MRSIFTTMFHSVRKFFSDEYDDIIRLDQFEFDLDGMMDPDEHYDNEIH